MNKEVVTLTWMLGLFQSPVTVTLGADGVATHTYTAGTVSGTSVVTATIDDRGSSRVATTALQLRRVYQVIIMLVFRNATW